MSTAEMDVVSEERNKSRVVLQDFSKKRFLAVVNGVAFDINLELLALPALGELTDGSSEFCFG